MAGRKKLPSMISRTWANEKLSEKWGKKAAARVFHIFAAGKDIEIEDPFDLVPRPKSRFGT